MVNVDTKDKLKTLFTGKSEEDIDKAVVDLKETLDQAAEEVKGDMDIGLGHLTVKNGKVAVKDGAPFRIEKTITVKKSSDVDFDKLGRREIYSEDYPSDANVEGRYENDPIVPFGEALWAKRANPVQEKVYEEYAVSKTISKIERKKKWNSFFSKIRIPVRLKTYSEESNLNEAMQALFLHLNYMDDESIDKLQDVIDRSRERTRTDRDRMETPILYAKPI